MDVRTCAAAHNRARIMSQLKNVPYRGKICKRTKLTKSWQNNHIMGFRQSHITERSSNVNKDMNQNYGYVTSYITCIC